MKDSIMHGFVIIELWRSLIENHSGVGRYIDGSSCNYCSMIGTLGYRRDQNVPFSCLDITMGRG